MISFKNIEDIEEQYEYDYIDVKKGALVKDRYDKTEYGIILKCGDNAWKPILVYWMRAAKKEYTLTCNLENI